MLAIIVVGASDFSAPVVDGGGGCGADDGGECEEAEATKEGDIFFPKRKLEKSEKEETSWIKGAVPWALN
jgi:hypothetical protein